MHYIKEVYIFIYNLFTSILVPEERQVEKLLALSQSSLRKVLPKAERPTERETFSLFDYRNKNVKALIWGIKYRNHPELLKRAGDFLHEEIIELAQDKMLFENKNEIALIPIPMNVKSERERGWNQSLEICKATSLPIFDILEKVKQTRNQRNLSREERLENIKDSMQIKENKTIPKNFLPIIIDDVYTTGATVREGRRALSKLGIKNCLAITLAH